MAKDTKRPILKQTVYNGVGLVKGGTTILRDAWPLGEGYYSIMIDIINTTVIGTGAGAVAEGELLAIRDIMLKTDTDGIIFKACGRQLFRRAQKIQGTVPQKDVFAAASAVYRVHIPFHFANRRARRPEDTILNTGRYRNIELHITMGTEADLLAASGTAVATFTANIIVEKTVLPVDETNAPVCLPYVMGLPPVIPTAQQFLDIEKNPDLVLLDMSVVTTNTSTAGIPCSGVPSNTELLDLTVNDNFMMPFRAVNLQQLQSDNKSKYSLEAIVAGNTIIDFMEDSSIFSGYTTGDKSVCQLTWTNDPAIGGAPQVTVLLDGIKRMK